MAAVHRFEDPVAARLHRQVEVGHQLGDLAVSRNQRLGHVGRMAGRVADPLQAGDPVERSNQVGEAAAAVGPGIHVLAEQYNLFRPAGDQCTGLVDHILPRPRDFGAARIGNDTVSAEFVAAFLDGEKGTRCRPAARWKRCELGQRRQVGIDRPGAGRRLGDHRRQVVVGLRADDNVDHG
jgi:hypothetical protein